MSGRVAYKLIVGGDPSRARREDYMIFRAVERLFDYLVNIAFNLFITTSALC
jgi:hypothetical protein